MQVALLDDDETHNALTRGLLEAAGWDCACFTRPQEFLTAFRRQTFDLVMVDWNMPGMDGLQVIAAMNALPAAPPPVLLVTSRSQESDVVAGLNAGADDYIVKPADPAVLVARVNALVRRLNRTLSADAPEQFGAYRLDPASDTVHLAGEAVVMTAKEFQLARQLFANAGRALSREYLLEKIWGQRPDLESRTLDAHVSRLRSKLSLRPDNGFRLVTVYGFGYRLEPCEMTAASMSLQDQ
ncbi:response regulator transcription factor [Caulobacter segnis]|uniref:response regulator transcription factor n=1 Tax=Caulobacter segnis TaxID=88688 RepID=UPI00240F0B8D|nr:response regulator transcription factor [Caulobacter segnis]MDG2520766.1 response regulator transcription factor [Caulobacter segnis]